MCLTPYMVKEKYNSHGHTIPVPCGKCPKCVARRTSAWSFRLMQEEKISQSAHFITLTYDTQHVPITPKGFMNLSKRDVQLFFKKLRKLNKNATLKYYTAGEYGGRTSRPHYHIILYNAELATIQKAWEKGQVHYGKVEAASIGYCLKYISKPKTIPKHANDDRQREFSLMSKGLGKNYITPAKIKWHKKGLHTSKISGDTRMYLNIEGGKKIAMPRYYKEKIYHKHEQQALGAVSRAQSIKKEHEAVQQSGGWSEYYRDQRARIDAAYKKMHKKATSNEKI